MLLCQECYSQICVNTSSNYKMFGSVLRFGVLNRGHELAFQDGNFSDHQQYSAETDAELARQIENMSSGKCSIVLGLFTSRECLIAGPIFKKNKLIGISSSCGHDNITQFSPYLYTIIPPVSKFSEMVSNYLNNKRDTGKIFIFYQPTDVYSQTGLNTFKTKFTKPIIEIPVESDGQFDINKFSIYKNDNVTIVFFTYPLPSVKILVELSDNQLLTKKTIVIGASSWTFDVSVFRPIRPVLEKAQDIIATDVLDWKEVKKSKFVKNFISKFNREPLNIEVLTYDVTRLSIDCYKKSLIKNIYSIKRFQNCMTSTEHRGVSGPYFFNKDSPFAQRPLYMTHFLDRM